MSVGPTAIARARRSARTPLVFVVGYRECCFPQRSERVVQGRKRLSSSYRPRNESCSRPATALAERSSITTAHLRSALGRVIMPLIVSRSPRAVQAHHQCRPRAFQWHSATVGSVTAGRARRPSYTHSGHPNHHTRPEHAVWVQSSSRRAPRRPEVHPLAGGSPAGPTRRPAAPGPPIKASLHAEAMRPRPRGQEEGAPRGAPSQRLIPKT